MNASRLLVTPDTLFINNQDFSKTIWLSTKMKKKVDFKIGKHPEWLSIQPLEGVIDGDISSINVRTKEGEYDLGTYQDTIEILSEIAGTHNLITVYNLIENSDVTVYNSKISFPIGKTVDTLTIKNTGKGELYWRISNIPEWLELKYLDHLYEGEVMSIPVYCDKSGYDVNTYSSYLTLSAVASAKVDTIPIEMEVPEIIDFEVSPSNIIFDYFSVTNEITIRNTGNTSFSWNIELPNSIEVVQHEGNLEKGDDITLTLEIGRSSLPHGSSRMELIVNIEDGSQDIIEVLVNNFIDSKIFITGDVVDAEYCKATDQLFFVTKNPNQLSIYDPATQELSSIKLGSKARCLSVISDGSLAVTGHNGYITYIDLLTHSLKDTYRISHDVTEITIADNKWTYICPATATPLPVIAFDYTLGTSWAFFGTFGGSYSPGGIFKIQPSSGFVYAKSSDGIAKFDISTGPAKHIYISSTLHSHVPDFWFYEDSDWIITGLFILQPTSIKHMNVVPNPMNWHGGIVCADHSTKTNSICATMKVQNNTFVAVYDDTDFKLLNTFDLEPFMIQFKETNGTLKLNNGKYLFLNSEGTLALVLAEPIDHSEPLWAIQSISINN